MDLVMNIGSLLEDDGRADCSGGICERGGSGNDFSVKGSIGKRVKRPWSSGNRSTIGTRSLGEDGIQGKKSD